MWSKPAHFHKAQNIRFKKQGDVGRERSPPSQPRGGLSVQLDDSTEERLLKRWWNEEFSELKPPPKFWRTDTQKWW